MHPRHLYKILLTAVALVFLTVPALAQQTGQITGSVTEARTGNPVPNVLVTLEENIMGTLTNARGMFLIVNVPAGPHQVSAAGMGWAAQTQDIQLSAGQTLELTFELVERPVNLDELVVTSYATMQRRERLGAQTQVRRDEIEVMPIRTAEEAMQGRTAGVQVRSNSGMPGDAPTIRIRGIASINANANPLYIVDGVQIAADRATGGTYRSSPLSSLNPDDIESIEVLKDVSATSIYGAQGAHGVVLITTRRGDAGDTQITFKSEVGLTTAMEKWDVLNGPDWVGMQMEAYANYYEDRGFTREYGEQRAIDSYGHPDEVGSYDWQDAILRTGVARDFNMSVSGGSADTRFFLSGGYERQDANLKHSQFNRMSVRANLDHRATERLSLLANLGLTHTSKVGEFGGNCQNCPFWAAPHMRPIIPIYNEDGSYNLNVSPIPYNLLVQINEEERSGRTRQAIGNITANYAITPRLNFRSLWGMDFRTSRETVFQPPEQQVIGDNGSEYYREVVNWTTNQVLEYRTSLSGGHSLGGLAGFEYRDEAYEYFEGQGTGYPSGLFRVLDLAGEPSDVSGGGSGMKIASYFGRAQYDYMGRYLFSGSIRRDGSSRFGSDRRWGLFYSVSGGWDISQETFMYDSPFDELTLRASYGTTGNSAISDFEALTLFGAGSSYVGFAGLQPTNLGNDRLTWEKAKSTNLGVTWGLFRGRLSGAIDVFRTDNTDLLLSAFLPDDSGFGSVTRNVGTVRNQGIEFEVAAVPIQTDQFTWRTDFNIAYLQNEVIELEEGQENIGSTIRVGEPRLIFWGYRYAGVNPADGRPMWYDEDGNLSYRRRSDMQQVIGSRIPKYTGGFNNSLQYGPIRLDAFLQFVLGLKAQSTQLDNLTDVSITRGLDKRVFDRWQKPGDMTWLPKAYRSSSYPGTSSTWGGTSTHELYDGGFVRLKHVTLGIEIPERLVRPVGVTGGRMYFQGTNLYTWTKFPGLDPEVQDSGNTWPGAIQLTFGLELRR